MSLPQCTYVQTVENFGEFTASAPVPLPSTVAHVGISRTDVLHYHSFKVLGPIFTYRKLAKARIKVFEPRKIVFTFFLSVSFDQRVYSTKFKNNPAAILPPPVADNISHVSS